MARSKDQVSIQIWRGEPKSPDHNLVGQWFKYRMDEIFQDLRMHVEDQLGWDKRQMALRFNMRPYFVDEAGPQGYEITGFCDIIGMPEIFQEFIARVGEAFKTMEPFMANSRLDFGHNAIRSPWFVHCINHGLLINTSKKALKIRAVGKASQLGNGRKPKPVFDGMDNGLVTHDTQVEELWVIGEPNEVDNLVSIAREVIRRNYADWCNDDVLSLLRSKMGEKAVVVVETNTDNYDGQGFYYMHQPLIGGRADFLMNMAHYEPTMEKFARCVDKFDYQTTAANLTCPGELVQRVMQHTGFRLNKYNNFRIRDTLNVASS